MVGVLITTTVVRAQGAGVNPTIFPPGQPNWQFDPETTQIGRNAERARQLVYWVYSHPPRFNVPVLAEANALVRNITYALTVLVIIGLALHLVIANRTIGPTFTGISIGMEKLNVQRIIFRVVAILIFVTFSYVIVRGMIEAAEISSQFLQRIAGEDLFNVVFGAGQSEENYKFVGYRNFDPFEQDMVFTSLFIVKLTSFTYNFLSVIVILRQIILMFLLVISPLLGLLLAFIFIRNTGYIWIGEFFRWLFYGPLLMLFLVALAKIWKAGIPYQFDFTRAQAGERIYETGINILYGGPAQVDKHPLSPVNTSNYVDTYAEYVIAVIMLWAAILLPWLLLRIFRDYCCEALEQNRAAVMQLLQAFRGVPPVGPRPPTGPKGPTEQVVPEVELPFRQTVQTPRTQPPATAQLTRERIIERIRDREVATIETRDIQRAFNLEIRSLRDVAKMETNTEQSTTTRQTLERIQNPYQVGNRVEQQQYEMLRNEFTRRAAQGDTLARQVIQAATPRASQLQQTTKDISSRVLREVMQKPGVPVQIGASERSEIEREKSLVKQVAERTNVSQEAVREILDHVSQVEKATERTVERASEKQISTVTERLSSSREQIQQVLAAVPKETTIERLMESAVIEQVSQSSNVEREKVEQILSSAQQTERTIEERVEVISQSIGQPQQEVRAVLEALPKDTSVEELTSTEVITSVSQSSNVEREKVEQILKAVPQTERTMAERVEMVTERMSASREQVKTVLEAMPKATSLERINSSVIQKVSEQTEVSKETVERILSTAAETERVSERVMERASEQQITMVSDRLTASREQVQQVLSAVPKETSLERIASTEIVNMVSQSTDIEREKVQQILSSAASTERSMEERVAIVTERTNLSQEQVRTVLAAVPKETSAERITSTEVVNSVSETTNVEREKVEQILKTAKTTERSIEERVDMITQQVTVPQQKIQAVLAAIPKATSLERISSSTVQQIAKETNTSEETVERILSTAAETERVSERVMERASEQQITMVSDRLTASREQVQQVLAAVPKETSMERVTSTEVINNVSQATNVEREKVEQILSSAQTTQRSTAERVEMISKELSFSREEVQQVLAAVPKETSLERISSTEVINNVSQATSVEREKVEQILKTAKTTERTMEERVEMVTEKMSASQQQIKAVLSAVPADIALDQVNTTTISQVAEKTKVAPDVVEHIISTAAVTERTTERTREEQVTQIAQEMGIEKEKVMEVLRFHDEVSSKETLTSDTITNTISTQTKLTSETVRSVLQNASQTMRTKDERITYIAEHTAVSRDQVKTIMEAVPAGTDMTNISSTSVISAVAEKTQLESSTVEQVLKTVPQTERTMEERVEMLSEKLSMPQQQIQAVLMSAPTALLSLTTALPALPAPVVAAIAEKASISEQTVTLIIETARTTERTKEEKNQLISEKLAVPVEQVKTIIEALPVNVTPLTIAAPATVSAVAEKTHIDSSRIQSVLQTVSSTERTQEEKLSYIAEKTNTTTETVSRVLELTASEIRTKETTAIAELTPAVIQQIAEKTNVTRETIEQIISVIPDTARSVDEHVQLISQQTTINPEQVKTIMQAVPSGTPVSQMFTESVIATVSQQTGIERETVETVLKTVPQTERSEEERITMISDRVGIPKERVSAVLGAIPVAGMPKAGEGPVPESPVTLEEYEEVRHMWMNHYRESEIPVSENVKSRDDWVDTDILQLTNTMNLLTSPSAKDRQKGMERVSTLLPFLLLGGFSDLETLTYIKAKLEAAKLVKDELVRVAAVTEEELVRVPVSEEVGEVMVKPSETALPDIEPVVQTAYEKRMETVHTNTKVARERIIEKIRDREITTVKTHDIQRAFNLEIRSLRDVARLETDKKQNAAVRETLNRIQNPLQAQDPEERQQYEALHTEFTRRSAEGDTVAQHIIQAATPAAVNIKQVIQDVSSSVLQGLLRKPGIPLQISATLTSDTITNTISTQTKLTSETVRSVLQNASQTMRTKDERITYIAEHTAVSRDQVKTIMEAVPAGTDMTNISSTSVISAVAEKTQLESSTVEQVLKTVPQTERTMEERVEMLSEKLSMPQQQIQAVLMSAPTALLSLTTALPALPAPVVAAIAEKASISEQTVTLIIETARTTERTKEEKNQLISEKLAVPVEQVKTIIEALPVNVTPLTIAAPATVSAVAEKTHIDSSRIQSVLQTVSSTERTQEEKLSYIAEKTNTTTETVSRVLELTASEIRTKETTAIAELTPAVIQQIAEKTNVTRETIEQIISVIPDTARSVDEHVQLISQQTTINPEQVKTIMQAVPSGTPVSQMFTESVIATVSQQTGIERETVETVLKTVPQTERSEEERITMISDRVGIPKERVSAVLGAIPVAGMPKAGEGPVPESPVTLEEYEEVRHMWMNHYRESEIPVSENVKSRDDWVDTDILQLTNTMNLLTSPSAKDRQKGMERVSTLLPFLLLGGFSDLETLTYIKAKLEAAKLVKDELVRVAAAKEEELVKVPVTEEVREENINSFTAQKQKDEENGTEQEDKAAMSTLDEALSEQEPVKEEKPEKEREETEDQNVTVPAAPPDDFCKGEVNWEIAEGESAEHPRCDVGTYTLNLGEGVEQSFVDWNDAESARAGRKATYVFTPQPIEASELPTEKEEKAAITENSIDDILKT